ncbi:HAD family hydrolase [Haloplanus sp. GCM10025708]|uniref:HAD family hydrolase n=1 Tax=Haloferacaceae TaxID=1644056 RepID=UPI003618A15A
MTVAAVAFDLDYTLAVPTRSRSTLLSEATAAVGAPPLSREDYLDAHADNLTRRTRAPIFERLLDGREADVEAATLAAAYRERVNDALEPVPGVESMLADLRERYRLGLLTNGPVVAQRSKLRELGWEDAFDVALVTGDLRSGKPDAAAFEALLDALGAKPEETAFVGDDADADVAGASDAGLRAIQVRFPDGPDPDPKAAAQVDRERMAAELPAILETL